MSYLCSFVHYRSSAYGLLTSVRSEGVRPSWTRSASCDRGRRALGRLAGGLAGDLGETSLASIIALEGSALQQGYATVVNGMREAIDELLRQKVEEQSSCKAAREALTQLLLRCSERNQTLQTNLQQPTAQMPSSDEAQGESVT